MPVRNPTDVAMDGLSTFLHVDLDRGFAWVEVTAGLSGQSRFRGPAALVGDRFVAFEPGWVPRCPEDGRAV